MHTADRKAEPLTFAIRAVDFLQPVLDEYLHDYPEIPILLRGDSGFSTPDLYNQCEMCIRDSC